MKKDSVGKRLKIMDNETKEKEKVECKHKNTFKNEISIMFVLIPAMSGRAFACFSTSTSFSTLFSTSTLISCSPSPPLLVLFILSFTICFSFSTVTAALRI